MRRHEFELIEHGVAVLGDLPGVTLYGPPDAQQRGGVFSFTLEGVHPHDVGRCSTGRASPCAPATTARSR